MRVKHLLGRNAQLVGLILVIFLTVELLFASVYLEK